MLLLVSVSDTGYGISAANQQELFKPFNRLGAENTEVEGTGIGLVISKKLVEAMDGDIGMNSKVGEGSTFWFTIPLAGNTGATLVSMARGEETTEASYSGQTAKLLYVEDNPANLELMRKIINRIDGLSMISANTGETGIEIARNEQPDVIILDINLPGKSGLEVLKELQKFDDTQNIPAIALSAAATDRDINRGIEAGFFRYLTKPFVVADLMTAVEEAMESDLEK